MENQNMTTEVKIAEINNMILRRIDALKELLKIQKETMEFLVKEGIDDSEVGEAIAESIGETIKAFGELLPEGIYERLINEESV